MKLKMFVILLITIVIFTNCASNSTSWQKVSDFGGIEIGEPYIENNIYYLPIKCDATGMTDISTTPKNFTSYPIYYTRAKVTIFSNNTIGIKLYSKLVSDGQNISIIQLPKKISKGYYSVKKFLYEVLLSILSPIRLKRQELQNQIPYIIKVLREGTEKANKAANETLLEIKKAMGIDYFDNDNFEKEQIAKYAK